MPRDKVMTQQKVGVVDSSKVSFCQDHNISSIENAFIATKLYQELKVRPKLHHMLSPSNVDDVLDGSYCSRYNDFVRNTGAKFNEPLPTNLYAICFFSRHRQRQPEFRVQESPRGDFCNNLFPSI